MKRKEYLKINTCAHRLYTTRRECRRVLWMLGDYDVLM